MAWRFNPPPGWPVPPQGWAPPPGWTPDPAWPPAPEGWRFWVEDPSADGAVRPIDGPPAVVPSGRRRGCGTALLVVVAIVAVIGLVAGISALLYTSRSTLTRDLRTEAPSGAVRVDHSCGPITLREGEPGVVTTRATVRYVWREPAVTSVVEGERVVVTVDCPWASFGASVDLVVAVPPDGTVEARTSAGSVTAEGVSSALTLSSSAGSVTARDVTSPSVAAESSAGAVSLSWAPDADPSRITARSSAGSVSVLVPDLPGVAYRCDAGSSAGRSTVEVRTDPTSERTISARSSAGSVLVGYR